MITGLVGALLVISCVMVFSANLYTQPIRQVVVQGVAILIGLAGILVIRLIPNRWIDNKHFLNFLLLITTGLIMFASLFGVDGGGARSWIDLKFFKFQPSEVMKPLMVLTIARVITYTKRTYLLKYEKGAVSNYYIPLVLVVLSLILIGSQPDYGSVLILVGLGVAMAMLFLLPPKTNLLLVAGALVLIGLALGASRVFGDFLVNSNYHVFERIGIYINPFNYAQTDGFQIISSYLSFAKGGWFGLGLGQGHLKAILPAADTDFILAVIAEEFGFIGCSLVVLLLMTLIFYLLRVAATMNRRFHRVSIAGFALLLLIQTCVNVGGLSGLIPLTGVTLPFLSYGGTSMIINLTLIGFVQKMIAEEKRMRQRAQMVKVERLV